MHTYTYGMLLLQQFVSSLYKFGAPIAVNLTSGRTLLSPPPPPSNIFLKLFCLALLVSLLPQIWSSSFFKGDVFPSMGSGFRAQGARVD